jgi:hypothetical protein
VLLLLRVAVPGEKVTPEEKIALKVRRPPLVENQQTG